MTNVPDSSDRTPFHRGWIGLALAAAVVLVVVFWGNRGDWLSGQVGFNRQATGLEAISTPPGGSASQSASQPGIQTAPKAKDFCPT